MCRKILLLCFCFLSVATIASAWSVQKKIEYEEETQYVIKCDNGKTSTVKQLHSQKGKKAYSNGWWYVVKGSYISYNSMEPAVLVGCKYAE